MYHCIENNQLIRWTTNGKFKHFSDAVSYMKKYLDDISSAKDIEWVENKPFYVEGVEFAIVFVLDLDANGNPARLERVERTQGQVGSGY